MIQRSVSVRAFSRAFLLLLVATAGSVFANEVPQYFVKVIQPRTLFAQNEPIPIILRVGNQSERNMRTRKLPDVLGSIVVKKGDKRLKLDPKFKTKDLFKRLNILEMGAHKDFRLNIKRLFPEMEEGGVFSIGYRDKIYDLTMKNIRIAKVDLPPMDAHFVLKTSMGDITIKLHEDQTPRHARNFAVLSAIDFYKDMIVHRVDKGFVMQTGDPLGDGSGGSGYHLMLENTPLLKHKKYTVGAARANDRDSANSQFYICLEDSPYLDNDYTVFGEVVAGFDVVDAIGAVRTTGREGKPPNRPLDEIAFEKVEIVPQGKN
ncbi:peptidylprolyl isomerase [Acanthopleuribacter pedis]|uniref:peptidylprolyl isomerase n=1 Tax=Acanthopleuribacter pedis TaxID=442870 RepID=A0A8J7Q999_9BACT|nr:peptidylprolyl isomerase [Acanthopleuribacter pedis]MBO1320082.1 peptidylprolyl isomerase [Acanthopleuribacter pedis]